MADDSTYRNTRYLKPDTNILEGSSPKSDKYIIHQIDDYYSLSCDDGSCENSATSKCRQNSWKNITKKYHIALKIDTTKQSEDSH